MITIVVAMSMANIMVEEDLRSIWTLGVLAVS
jgi:hypothetical protein